MFLGKKVFGSSHLPHTVYSELLHSNNILGYVFKFELDIWRRNNLTSERWVSEQELECSAVLFTESMHCTNKTKFDADATGIGMSMLNSFLFFLRTQSSLSSTEILITHDVVRPFIPFSHKIWLFSYKPPILNVHIFRCYICRASLTRTRRIYKELLELCVPFFHIYF